MILVRRPSPARVDEYRLALLMAEPTALPAEAPPPGFRREVFRRKIGTGSADFERARRGLEQWVAHRGSGVEVHPAEAVLDEGGTVAIVTRQLRLWVLAACRVMSVIDEPRRFGFVYATLPDHPACGYESFVVEDRGDEITFAIEAVSQPGIPLVRLGAPITKQLQRRASEAYLDALEAWVRTPEHRL